MNFVTPADLHYNKPLNKGKEEYQMKKIVALALATTMALGLLSGCAGKPATSSPSPSTTPSQEGSTNASGMKAVFVVTGQLGDKSFNDSAAAGVNSMAEKLGVETKIIEIGRDQTKWEPTFMDLAESGEYDIIITNGSNAGELVTELSAEFPEQKFILFDTEIETGAFPNVYSISYKQNEASYLAGVMAALVTTSDMPNANAEKKIGFVGGEVHPIISDFLVGYVEGAKSVDPEIKVYVSYVGSWDDTAKGKESALAQYNQGVDIIFPAAEQAGLGCVDAAVEQGKYIVGVDSDQAMLFKGTNEEKANVILTSVLKEVGNSLVRAVSLDQEGKLTWGTFESLGLAESGVGIAKNEYYETNLPQDIKDAVTAAEAEVAAGKITVTTALGGNGDAAQAVIDSVAP